MTQGTAEIVLRQTLVDALRARAAMTGVQVLYAVDQFTSTDDHLRDEAIWFGDAEWPEMGIATIKAGTQHYNEAFELDFFVQVVKADGSTQEAADVRGLALVVELQQQLAELPQVGGVAWAEAIIRHHHVGQLSPGPGHGSQFAGVIRATARLA